MALSAGILTAALGAHAIQFQVTITNLGPQPLSPVFVSASDASFNLFSLGGQSSAGIKAIAEGGNTTPELTIAAAAGSAIKSYAKVGAAPFTAGGSVTGFIDADAAHPYFSFAVMLGKTNDGFLGESVSSAGISLFQNDAAQGFTTIITGLRAWDAGTEKNTQNAADLGFLGGSGNPAEDAGLNFIRLHNGVVAGVGDSSALLPSWSVNTQLASISVTPVPEPTALLAIAPGLAALLLRKRKA